MIKLENIVFTRKRVIKRFNSLLRAINECDIDI